MTTAASYLSAGLLLGFAGAYVGRVPLTMGRVTILAGFGILILCKKLLYRTGPKHSFWQIQPETPKSKV
jgi:hypothetical protein